jgi:hypothetical protein
MKIFNAIKSINPNADIAIRGSDIDTCEIDWLNGTAEISKADIQTKMAELETAYDNNAYQRTRAAAYSEVKEQLDLLYHDMAADKGDKTGEWFKAVKKVKDDNPKS